MHTVGAGAWYTFHTMSSTAQGSVLCCVSYLYAQPLTARENFLDRHTRQNVNLPPLANNAMHFTIKCLVQKPHKIINNFL